MLKLFVVNVHNLIKNHQTYFLYEEIVSLAQTQTQDPLPVCFFFICRRLPNKEERKTSWCGLKLFGRSAVQMMLETKPNNSIESWPDPPVSSVVS